MNGCWSEGELRAYLDRELPREDMERVAAHLEECSECGDLWAELAGRAARITAWMEDLTPPDAIASVPRLPGRTRGAQRWLGPVAALAAGLALAAVGLSRRTPPASPPAPQPASVAIVQPEVPAVEGATSVSVVTPVARTVPRRRSMAARKPASLAGGFVALDDEPIESGVMWRVALGPNEVPADVIFSSDGRARAIRLVNSNSKR